MMFALNFAAVRYGLKSSVSPFLIHIKPKEEKGGAEGENPFAANEPWVLPPGQ